MKNVCCKVLCYLFLLAIVAGIPVIVLYYNNKSSSNNSSSITSILNSTSISALASLSVSASVSSSNIITKSPTPLNKSLFPSASPPSEIIPQLPEVLILYDTTGSHGYNGELYAIVTANLVSHFNNYKIQSVSSYKSEELYNYSHMI